MNTPDKNKNNKHINQIYNMDQQKKVSNTNTPKKPPAGHLAKIPIQETPRQHPSLKHGPGSGTRIPDPWDDSLDFLMGFHVGKYAVRPMDDVSVMPLGLALGSMKIRHVLLRIIDFHL